MNKGIKKFKSIKSFGSFRDFVWDNSVKDRQGSVCLCDDVNIIYGRNYSGKTTLSRIVRAMQLKQMPEHYEGATFQVEFGGGTIIDQTLTHDAPLPIRVFNQDFVCDNLGFLRDTRVSNSRITSFAVLGEANNRLEKEVKHLNEEIGDDKPGHETGLRLKLATAAKTELEAFKRHKTLADDLDGEKKRLATDKTNGIKYNADIYGDLNYTVKKLEDDLRSVRSANYVCLGQKECEQLKSVVAERPQGEVQAYHTPMYEFGNLLASVSELSAREVVQGEKIQELLADVIKERWARDGLKLHDGSAECRCLFCGNKIGQKRWEELNAHFADASEKLNSDIERAIVAICKEMESHEDEFSPNKLNFYSEFHIRIDELVVHYKATLKSYKESLRDLKKALQKRQSSLGKAIEFVAPKDMTKTLEDVFADYESICKENNAYTKNLSAKQIEARRKLRLNHVYEFDQTHQLQVKERSLTSLHDECDKATAVVNDVRSAINEKEAEVAEKRRAMNDQTRAVNLINGYLTWLGDHTFTLKPEVIDNEGVKTVYFKVFRGANPAYNLSEGECNLIAFCYFLATLSEPELVHDKSIVWIDDPICSLDSNHVYFVYAMIRNVIIAEGRFEQFFVSTHNLDFLRYLHRLNGVKNKDGKSYQNRWLMMECINGVSSINMMPDYLRNYVTEFSYLFKKIYQCAIVSATDDNFAGVLYDFGNSARRFLELYLYFKFPNAVKDDREEHLRRMQEVFGDKVKSFMVDRVVNEGSHLAGQLERGMSVCDTAEAQQVAREILKRLKHEDQKQYEELLKGIDVAADPLAP